MYPVKGKKPQEILKNLHAPEDDYEFVMRKCLDEANVMFTFNRADTLFCESLPHRRDKVFDILIWGQDLFRLSEDGEPFVKRWGCEQWEQVLHNINTTKSDVMDGYSGRSIVGLPKSPIPHSTVEKADDYGKVAIFMAQLFISNM